VEVRAGGAGARGRARGRPALHHPALDEAPLTGEAEPKVKQVDPVASPRSPSRRAPGADPAQHRERSPRAQWEQWGQWQQWKH